MPTLALYAGSFDPITNGHADLIRRSLGFVDHLVVAVAVNSGKDALFTQEERVALIKRAMEGEPRVEVRSFQGLLVEFARASGIRMIIRGLRAVSDFEYEYQMALMNRHLGAEIETVFMIPSLETTHVSSSLVREVARHGGDVTSLVHPAVHEALKAKYRRG